MNNPGLFAVGTADDGSIRVRGELDLSHARLLQDHLDAVIDCEVGDIVVDLFHVSFIDASGLRALITTDRRLRAAGRRRLRIVTQSAAVRRLLDLAKLTDHFETLPDPLPAVG